MKVITRFAPSPTGILHIGNARTALFNYLFAKHNFGKFLLRIEDTDLSRFNKFADNYIIDSLRWLGINWDNEFIVYQSKRLHFYQQVVDKLLKIGKAYYCFTTQDEITQMKHNAIENKFQFVFRSKWRDIYPKKDALHRKPVVRFKVNTDEVTVVKDQLLGNIYIKNDSIEDFVLLRSDNTPTYALAVVVDDNYMNITHIIRGNDHLTNTAKQLLLYDALLWKYPHMVHIPLIHNSDGTKLSKRNQSIGVLDYKNNGYLAEALNSYLLKLGWGIDDDTVISKESAIKLFTIDKFSKSSCKFDTQKINYINGYYLRNMDNTLLCDVVISELSKKYILTEEIKNYIAFGINSLKLRVNLLTELIELSKIYLVNYPLNIHSEFYNTISNKNIISDFIRKLKDNDDTSKVSIQGIIDNLVQCYHIKKNDIMLQIRILLTGNKHGPSIFEIIEIIGINNSINRLSRCFDEVYIIE